MYAVHKLRSAQRLKSIDLFTFILSKIGLLLQTKDGINNCFIINH